MSFFWLLSLFCVEAFAATTPDALDVDVGDWAVNVKGDPPQERFLYSITSHKNDEDVKRRNEKAVKIADKEIDTQFGKIRMHLYGDVDDLCPKEPGKEEPGTETEEPEKEPCEPRYAVITIKQEGNLAGREISTNRAAATAFPECNCGELEEELKKLKQENEELRHQLETQQESHARHHHEPNRHLQGEIILVRPYESGDECAIGCALREKLVEDSVPFYDLGKLVQGQGHIDYEGLRTVREFISRHGGVLHQQNLHIITQIFCEIHKDNKKYIRLLWKPEEDQRHLGLGTVWDTVSPRIEKCRQGNEEIAGTVTEKVEADEGVLSQTIYESV